MTMIKKTVIESSELATFSFEIGQLATFSIKTAIIATLYWNCRSRYIFLQNSYVKYFSNQNSLAR